MWEPKKHYGTSTPPTDSDTNLPNTSPPHQHTSDVEISDIIGGYGPWQRDIYILLFLASIPGSWHSFQMTFMAPNGVEFWCARPEYLNITVEEWRNLSAPPTDLNLDSRCYVKPYWKLPKNKTLHESDMLKCTSWDYNSSDYPSTVINEWDLVCDRDWLISFSTSIFNIGYLFAVLVFGQLSDSIGRRPTLLISYVVDVVAGIVTAFSTSFAMFAVLRFFTAVGSAAFYTVSFVILLEIVSPSYRSSIGISINFGWCLAFITLPAVAWFVRDWFWMQLALALPKFLFVSVFWMVPESPRWLMIRQDRETLKQVVLKASKKNGVSEDFAKSEVDKLSLMNKDLKTTPTGTIVDLFKTPRLRKHTLILFYNWLVNSFIYFGLSYNTGDLSPNPYLSFFLSGAVEFPAYLVTIKILSAAGRRKPMAFAMIIAGVACAIAIPIPKDIVALKAFFPLVGKFCITATFAAAYIYSAEIFPTVVRNVGLGTGSTVARIGSAVAPFVREIGAVTFNSFPDILYSLLSVSSGLLIFLLPETKNEPFADTLDQAENLGREVTTQKDAEKDVINDK